MNTLSQSPSGSVFGVNISPVGKDAHDRGGGVNLQGSGYGVTIFGGERSNSQ